MPSACSVSMTNPEGESTSAMANLDIRNHCRGFCLLCGKNGCEKFISVSGKVLCDYCGCPPAKHQMLGADGRPVDSKGSTWSSRRGRHKLSKSFGSESEASAQPESRRQEANRSFTRPSSSSRGRTKRHKNDKQQESSGFKGRIVYNSHMQGDSQRTSERVSEGDHGSGETETQSLALRKGHWSRRNPEQEDNHWSRAQSPKLFHALTRDRNSLKVGAIGQNRSDSSGKSSNDKTKSNENHKGSHSRDKFDPCISKRKNTPKEKESRSIGATVQRPTYEMPHRAKMLLDMPPVNEETRLQHAWNNGDHSPHIFVKNLNKLTCHRYPVAQSTDCIRGKVCYEKGIHAFEINWSSRQRGSHAVIGVATESAPLSCNGYKSLLGSNKHSWGWDIVSCQALHDCQSGEGKSYPANINSINPKWKPPNKFLVILNMDEGVLGFAVNDHYLGHAFRDLKGKKLYIMLSCVWGHAEITMKYIGGLSNNPLPLTDLCRFVIRQEIEEDNIAEGKLSELNLPKILVSFLEYQDGSPIRNQFLEEV